MTKKATIKDSMNIMLELLTILNDVCEQNSITYWIDGGTLLGARRSSTFIPWDDDLDVCLLYSDYLLLLEILREKCKNHKSLFLYNDVRDPNNWSNYFGDTRLLQDRVMPVRIDLVPIKCLPKEKMIFEKDNSLTSIAKYFDRGSFNHQYTILDEHKKFIGSELIAKTNFEEYFHNQHLKKYAKIDEKGVFTYSFNDALVKKEREHYAYQVLFPLKTILFENMEVPCPNKTDEYLTNLYGKDFLTPPPELKRVSHSKKYEFNSLDKERTLTRLKIMYSREYKYFQARSARNKLMRYYSKFSSFMVLSKECILNKEFKFIIIYLKFTFKDL